MNSAQTKQVIMPACRWGIKDALKVFFAYIILMFAGMPVIARMLGIMLGYNVVTGAGGRSLVLFISVFVNLLICSYVFYIACIGYRQPVTALGISTVNLPDNIKLGVKKYLLTLPIIILAGFIVNLISSYYGIIPDMQDVVKWVLEEKSIFILVCLIFFGIIIAPVMEEIIFRGFLQPALKNSLGGHYAVVVSASLFAAVHMDIFAFIQIFILGMLLGYLYEKTSTIAASMVVHIIHNSLTLVFLLYFKFFLKGKIPVF